MAGEIVKFEFRAASPIAEQARDLLHCERFHRTLADILPVYSDDTDADKHIERLIAQAGLAILQNPKLRACTQLSFLESMTHVAETGLSLARVSGEAYLVPFRDNKNNVTNCTFMPGYRGIIKLATQTGGVASVDAFPVHDRKRLQWWEDDTGTHCRYEPDLDEEYTDEQVTDVIARIQLLSGGRIVKRMTRKQVEKIRSGSKNKDGDTWKYHWGEMALKTVIKRALKTVPHSVVDKAVARLQQAIELDNKAAGFYEEIEQDVAQRRKDKEAAWDQACGDVPTDIMEEPEDGQGEAPVAP
jgi:recombination protein RecT